MENSLFFNLTVIRGGCFDFEFCLNSKNLDTNDQDWDLGVIFIFFENEFFQIHAESKTITIGGDTYDLGRRRLSLLAYTFL